MHVCNVLAATAILLSSSYSPSQGPLSDGFGVYMYCISLKSFKRKVFYPWVFSAEVDSNMLSEKALRLPSPRNPHVMRPRRLEGAI